MVIKLVISGNDSFFHSSPRFFFKNIPPRTHHYNISFSCKITSIEKYKYSNQISFSFTVYNGKRSKHDKKEKKKKQNRKRKKKFTFSLVML